MHISFTTRWLAALVATLAAAGPAGAQHRDVLMQSDGAQIVVGAADFVSFSWTIGNRVFARDFDSDYLIDNPGFNALSDTSPFMPAGYFALPASSPIGWDFLPMTVGSAAANLLYWNGADTNANGVDALDVGFGTLAGAYISLAGSGGTAIADGSSQLVAGPTLVTTDSTGAVHSHRNFRLDDGDMNDSTNPPDGIYLIALDVRMATLETSDPFYLVFGTPGSTLAARNAAADWVTDRIDMLVVDGLPGDYNGDHVVDAADYTVWRDALNRPTALPNEAASPNVVDAVDYDVWKLHFGETLPAGDGAKVAMSAPEPCTMAILAISSAAVTTTMSRKRRARHAPESAPQQR